VQTVPEKKLLNLNAAALFLQNFNGYISSAVYMKSSIVKPSCSI